MEFDCDKCGCCCRILDSLHEHLSKSHAVEGLEISIIKDMDSGNGVCKHLGSDNLCTIYKDRPEICDTSKLYDRLSKIYPLDKEDYYTNIKRTCIWLRSCDGIRSE